jgi:hypothetical protein
MKGIISKSIGSMQGAMSSLQNNVDAEKVSTLINTKMQEVSSTLATTVQNMPMPHVDNQTLNDINNQLITLNNVMAHQLKDIAETMRKQYNVTKGMSSDILSRG